MSGNGASRVCDALVVGAGPAGAAVALQLHQRGHDVLLVDEARFPRDKICGEAISPGAWPLLRALGADRRVRELRPHPIRGMLLTAPDGTCFAGGYDPDREPGLAIRREGFDAALLDTARAAGVEVRERTRASDLRLAGGAVVGAALEGADGRSEVRARLVVGADGRRSLVARRLGLLREHPRWRKFGVRGYWKGMEGLGERGEMHVGSDGYCGVAPLAWDTANVTFVLDRRRMAAAGGDLEGFYRSALRRWPRIQERLTGARLLSAPRAIGPLALEARAVSAPGALLVGDSAGFYDPFTGEGVTLALRSAEIAAEVADQALRLGTLGELREYDRRRGEATREKFRLNRLLQTIVCWPAAANAVARRLARRRDLADRLVGVAGDFVPARAAFELAFLWELIRG